MKILVVDDDENIRDVLGMILRAKGHDVDEASDGVEALARLGRTHAPDRPELILLDMMMPRLDGEAVIDALKRDPALASIAVVLLSGHQLAREQADRLGVAGCLVKPVELSELLATVQRIASAPASPPA